MPSAATIAALVGETVTEGKERHMATSTVEVFVAAFGNEDEADAAVKDFKAMDREGTIELIDAAAIVHSADGKVHFKETADPSGSPPNSVPAWSSISGEFRKCFPVLLSISRKTVLD